MPCRACARQSLTDLLARVPAEARPGVQALSFHVLRWLGGAPVRARWRPRRRRPGRCLLLTTALALLWPLPDRRMPSTRWWTRRCRRRAQRTPAAAAFVNAVLRRFLREREALVAAAGADRWRLQPPAVVDRAHARDWPQHWQPCSRPPTSIRR
jgi:16S rRNA (cytosine967-C5)-methyltransferase